MLITENISYFGLQKFPTDEENKYRVKSAITLLVQRYPGISIENYSMKYVGIKSMNLSFTVSSSDSLDVKGVGAYFDEVLMQQGYTKERYQGDTLAIGASIIEMTGKRYEKPWWKFWE